MTYHQNLAQMKTLVDYCALREQAADCYRHGLAMIQNADRKLRETGCYSGLPYDAVPRCTHDEAVRGIDRSLWRRAFDVTGFAQLLDAQAIKEFNDSLDKDPPAFTEANVRSHFVTFAQDAAMHFRRGVYNVFRKLSSRYVANGDPFKLGDKFIAEHWITNWRGQLSLQFGREDGVNDLGRVLYTLDEREYPPRHYWSAINDSIKTSGAFEDEYIRLRAFKKGTAHVWFKRLDLRDRINQLIAEHCGDALPDGTCHRH